MKKFLGRPQNALVSAGLSFCFLLTSCEKSEADFEVQNLPVARMAYSAHGSHFLYVNYQSDRGTYRLKTEEFSDSSDLTGYLVGEVLAAGDVEPVFVFLLPEDFPASVFASVCRETQEQTGSLGKFHLGVFLLSTDISVNPGADTVQRQATFILGDIFVSDPPNIAGANIDSFRLDIRNEDYLLEGEPILTVETLRERLTTYHEAAELTDSDALLRIRIEEGVTIQRFISALDVPGVHQMDLVFLPGER